MCIQMLNQLLDIEPEELSSRYSTVQYRYIIRLNRQTVPVPDSNIYYYRVPH